MKTETKFIRVEGLIYDEKMAMYMKCTKKKLAEMLIHCSIELESIRPTISTLNLKDLERRLDEALEKETPESIGKWLNNKRLNDKRNPERKRGMK